MTPEQRKHFEFVRDEMHGEPEQQKVVWDEKIGGVGFDSPLPNANYKVIATVTPKQNQEPIAWLCKKDNGHFDVLTDQTCKKCFPVYTNDTSKERVAKTHENVHEPEWYHVIDVHGCNRFYHRTEDCPYKVKTPLYTHPPQRTWVGLTDKEIDEGLVRSNYAMQTAGAWRDGVEWATKQLKGKNT